MAPFVHQEEDFVLTISDNDGNDSSWEEEQQEEEEILPTATSTLNGTKRKRDTLALDEGPKKSKKSKKSAETAKPKTNDRINNEDETWATQAQDDGAMNSDFEFQVGDVDIGVVEDFDGWDIAGSAKAVVGRGDRKGVDIDELIARRRKKEDMTVMEAGTRSQLEDEEKNHDGVDQTHLHNNEISLPALDINLSPDEGYEDELLAPDGFGMGATGEDEESGDEGGMERSDQDDDQSSDEEVYASPVPHPDDQASEMASDDEMHDPAEKARREAFFAPEDKTPKFKPTPNSPMNSFQSMSLSRPILRGLASVGFSEPTPIQAKTIPVALLGKDVVGGAVTGSGKTAAFMIPILERLQYRPRKVPTSRVVILMPTRELAVQCFNVARKIAAFTDVSFCQLVGGFSLREQETVLRSRPDVIIATPGRFIDHMRNSASFTVDTLEILVLDEADRMLEDGFADELNEILTTIPKSRQTMLFSATMTDNVDKLIRVGMNRPVRLMVDARKQTVGTLVQEFVRLRPGREDKRLSYLMYLCTNFYTDRVIIFFRQKREAHRVRIIFGLCGFKAAELHGSLSQEQRISSIESFRSGNATHLLATDVASRGLDIKGVETVINYEAPQSHEIYLHRVGRTARAGRSGRACTIAAEPDRRVVKAAVKVGKAQGAKIVSRVVEAADIDAWATKLAKLDEEVEAVLKEEKEEKGLSVAEMSVRKGENLMEHAGEIMSRPRRTWFESEKEKEIAKEKGRTELNGDMEKKKKGKLSGKDKKKLDDERQRKEGRVWKKGKGEREDEAGEKRARGRGGGRGGDKGAPKRGKPRAGSVGRGGAGGGRVDRGGGGKERGRGGSRGGGRGGSRGGNGGGNGGGRGGRGK